MVLMEQDWTELGLLRLSLRAGALGTHYDL